MAPRRPTLYPKDAFKELAGVVERGHYRRYDDPSHIPSGLSRAAGFPTAENFRSAIVMASGTTQHPPAIGGIAPGAGTPIYRISVLRFDVHSDAKPHLNKDDVLVFEDSRGQPWQLYAADQPNHYRELSIDSGLSAALDIHRWPGPLSGSLAAMQQSGAYVDFSTGKPR